MITLYKKVTRTIQEPWGAREIKEDENPFLEPTMLCMSAQDSRAKSVFGITKTAMRAARIRVPDYEGARFDMETVPVNFLSLERQGKFGQSEEEEKEFVEKYFKPLIEEDGKRIDAETAKKRLRNINFYAYCNGLERVNNFIKFLEDDAVQLGYSETEIEDMLSQIAIISISTAIDINENKATCFDVFDFNDEEHEGANPNNIQYEALEQTKRSPIHEHLHINSPTKATYTLLGDGEHSVKKYITEGKASPVVLARVVSNCLQNSIQNHQGNDFVPLDMDVLTEGCSEIVQKACDGVSPEEQMAELDESLEYGGAERFTDRGLANVEALERAVDCYKDAKPFEKITREKNELINNIVKRVEDISSPRNYYEILEMTGYQLGRAAEEVRNTPSDKETLAQKDEEIASLRTENDELMQQNAKLASMLNKVMDVLYETKQSALGQVLSRLPEKSELDKLTGKAKKDDSKSIECEDPDNKDTDGQEFE